MEPILAEGETLYQKYEEVKEYPQLESLVQKF
jgi:hypothetical protein